jgi:hypothetical protein
MFFPFSSPIDLEELLCRRSQELRTSGRLKIRRCARSWLNNASPIVLEVPICVLIESAAVWRFCWALVVGNASDNLYFSSGAGRLNAFGIGAFALRHRPGEVPTIARKLRLKAGWSVNPTSNATVSKESFECNRRDFAASTRLSSK